MLWIKSLHIIFMVTWFAGLFYLPRLFVYHSLATPDDRIGIERFKTMERKLYHGIMTPAATLTIAFGLWLWLGYGITGGWLYAKLALVALPCGHHEPHAWLTVVLAKGQHDLDRKRCAIGEQRVGFERVIAPAPLLAGGQGPAQRRVR